MCKYNEFRKTIENFDKKIAEETDPIKKEHLTSLKLGFVFAVVSKEIKNREWDED